MDNNTLTCELNGTKYLLIEAPIFESNKDKIKRLVEKYDCIEQGLKELHVASLWSMKPSYAIVRLLVPEHYVESFNREQR